MQTPPTFSSQQIPPYQAPPAYRVRLAAIGEAWKIIMLDIWPWVILVFLLLVATSVVQVPLQMAFQGEMMSGMMRTGPAGSRSPVDPFQALQITPVMVAGFELLSLLLAGIRGFVLTLPQRFTLRKLRGLPATVNDMFSFDGTGWKVAAWWLVYPLIAGIVPGILMVGAVVSAGRGSVRLETLFFSPIVWIAYGFSIIWYLAAETLFVFVPLLIVDQGLSVVDAAKLSAKTVGPHILPMFGVVYICAAFLSSLGVCACYVGMFVTLSLQYATLGVVYNDFFRRAEPDRETPGGFYPRPQW